MSITSTSGSGALPSSLINVGPPVQRFIAIKMLGKGAQGFVQACTDTQRGRQVAVKYIKRGLSSDYYKYVLREVMNHQEISRFAHPHIVEFYEVFLTPKYLGVVMEHVDGADLHEYMTVMGGILNEDFSRFIFQQLILALDFCHRKGLGHRDIKLANILVLNAGNLPVIKLCDFGFSKDRHIDSAAQTQVGTALYAAPEVVQSPLSKTTYDAQRADLWSCGVVLYVMLFGGHPFVSKKQLSSGQSCVLLMMENSAAGNLQLPDNWERSVPGAVDLLKKILVADPSKRCSMSDILAHPWFLHKLPGGTLEINQQYGEAINARPFTQDPQTTMSVIHAARQLPPGGSSSTSSQGSRGSGRHDGDSGVEQKEKLQAEAEMVRQMLEEQQQLSGLMHIQDKVKQQRGQ